jgi:hypothetical protein
MTDLGAELMEIYPNPASAMTVIPVNAKAKTSGNIMVFNSLGQIVHAVFAGDFPSGASNYCLDAGNLIAGTYFVRLQTGTQVQMKKLVVRKSP